MEEQAPKYAGEQVKLAGQDYIVPSLSVKQARNLWPKIRELNKGITMDNIPDKMSIATEIIHAALSRNYPNLKLEEVEDMIDMSNFRRVVGLVTASTGLKGDPGDQPAAATAAAA